MYEILENEGSAIEFPVTILTNQSTFETEMFEIQFIKCSCELSQKDRRNVIRRHMSAKQKKQVAKQRRENYFAMEPVKKRVLLDNIAFKYKYMDCCERTALKYGKAERYQVIDCGIKQELSVQNVKKYRLMDSSKKRKLAIKNA